VIDGRLPPEEAADMGLPVEESDEYDTMAGWMLARLGHIPVSGESMVHGGVTFTVQAVHRRRIVRLLVDARHNVPGGAEESHESRT
ncbi:MAG: transporter associated domain-containing protein, partial [Coriobacteriia bacterium]|nr:transporter associated domain-containing protein [Coriobacteriia bacterium]